MSSPAAPAADFTSARRAAFDRPRRRGGPPLMVGAAIVVAIFAVLPVGLLAVQASSTGTARLQQLLLRPLVLELLVNTLLITIVATLAATVLGLFVAWCVERTNLPGKEVWSVLAGLPLAVPAFVTSYSWVSLTPLVQGFAGAALIVTLAYYPLVYLPVAAALRGMDPTFEETARALGHGSIRTFVRVILPQTRPALLGGALVVAIHLLAEFGAFAMLRFRTFTTVIYDEYRLSFNGPAASILASVLVCVCIMLLVVEVRMRGHARYVRSGAGAARPSVRVPLRHFRLPVIGLFAVLAAAALGLPLVTIAYWLTRTSAQLQPGALVASATTSVGLGLAAACLTTLIGLPIGYLTVRFPSRFVTLLERAVYVAYSLPGITVALAFIVLAVRFARPAYQTMPLLVAAYSILFLPLAVVSARAAFTQAPVAVEEAARSLGCGPWATFRRVTLPIIARGLSAGAALIFLFTLTELPATLLLSPIGTATLATTFWSNTRSLAYGAAAPYAALMICVSALPTYFLTRRFSAPGGMIEP